MELTVKRFEEFASRELYELLQVRVSIFVVEQNCPYQEVDGKDLFSYHILMKEDGHIQAYARVVDSDRNGDVFIGRVLTVKRGSGLGKEIMFQGIQVAKERMNASRVFIEAQSYARGFYEQLGFEQISNEFLEDGIPHVKMVLIF